jgi:hypothetical protein
LFLEQWQEAATGYGKHEYRPLNIRCKCQGVNLAWDKGAYEFTPNEDLPWFIDPATLKPLASSCACDNCRLSSGVDIFNWTFSELKFVSFPTTQAPHYQVRFKSTADLKAAVDAEDPSVGTLTYYASPPDVQRYFCSTCSACILYAVDDRPEIVDIAVGVLRAPGRGDVASLLSWSLGEVGGKEDTEGGWRDSIVTGVEREAEEWRMKRKYPKCWRRVAREEAREEAAADTSRDGPSRGNSRSMSGCGLSGAVPIKTKFAWRK